MRRGGRVKEGRCGQAEQMFRVKDDDLQSAREDENRKKQDKIAGLSGSPAVWIAAPNQTRRRSPYK
eukprot:3458613-Pleurochrysis_carterae.AAC.1